MPNPIEAELDDLRARVRRCEAIEACRCRFNQTLHDLDAGHVGDLNEEVGCRDAARRPPRTDGGFGCLTGGRV